MKTNIFLFLLLVSCPNELLAQMETKPLFGNSTGEPVDCTELMSGQIVQPPQHLPEAPQRQRPQGNEPQGIRPKEKIRLPAELEQKRVTLNIGKPRGKLKPLLGINAGPAPSGEPGNADLTAQYKWAGVREVRTQDYYGPLDLSIMYPYLGADPSNPLSFDFTSSDKVFAKILDSEAEPYLRLGDSYNNAKVPSTKKESDNYWRAAVKVVQHYRRGEMNGFKADFRYVEIGNEPDNRRFWPAPYKDFFPFFLNTFKEIKREIPELKVGGPGFVVSSYKIASAQKNVSDFLGYLKDNKICPDFISFHLYSDDPAEYYDIVNFYRKEAKKYGMEKVELHISEWNTEEGGIEMRTGREAAPYLTACWIALQEAGADVSCLFRGTDTNRDNPGFYGIFHADGSKKPSAYAFHLWSRMSQFDERLDMNSNQPLLDANPSLSGLLKPLWMLAGKDKIGDIAILVSNIGRQEMTCDLSLPEPAEEIEAVEFETCDRGLISRRLGSQNPILIFKPLSLYFIKIKTVKSK